MTFPLLVVIALLQSVLFSRVSVLGARPDLMVLAVLTWSVVRGADEGVVWGLIGGVLLGLLSAGPLGAISLALIAVAFVAGQPWGHTLGSPMVRLMLLGLICGIIYHVLLLASLTWTEHAVDWEFSMLRVTLPSAVLNAVLAPFVRPVMTWLDRQLRREGLRL